MKTVAPELLEEITRRLAAEFQPEQIILFGSHAWGTPDEDSDVDVCVIVSDSAERSTQRATRAYRTLRGMTAPIEVLVKTRREVEKYGRVAASLTAQILRDGKVLYATGKA